MRLQFFTEPAEFLARARDHLAADPVVSTVVATVAARLAAQGGEHPERDWWLVVRDDADEVVGAGMRSAPFAPYPLFLLPMPDGAAVELARVLHRRGEQVEAVNGALPAVRLCAEELARLTGATIEVSQHTRLHELRQLVPPKATRGRLAQVTAQDVELAGQWYAAFMGDADEQAGRPRGSSAHEAPDRAELLRRIEGGQLWFWSVAGRPVHLTAANPPAYGVSRIGPVYTPPSERGHGYASNAVAAVSGRILDQGARACLFTDQANPTSNRIYTALGYEPVVDMANFMVRTEPVPP